MTIEIQGRRPYQPRQQPVADLSDLGEGGFRWYHVPGLLLMGLILFPDIWGAFLPEDEAAKQKEIEYRREIRQRNQAMKQKQLRLPGVSGLR